jgi:hypothetical protein
MPENPITEIDLPELRTPFVFRPADLRPAWRIGLIVLLIKNCCRSNRTTRSRLQVLSWGFRSAEARAQLQAAVDGRLSPESLVVRFEPFLIQAVDFAIGEGLLRRHGGDRLEMTQAGLRLAEELQADESAYSSEKTFIGVLRTRVSEDLVNRMFGWRIQT